MAATHSTHTPSTRLGALRSRSSLIAWVLWGLSVALLLLIIPLFVAVTDAAYQMPTVFPFQLAQHLHLSGRGWFEVAITTVTILAFLTLGALIVTRHPENCIGWLFCTIGLLRIVGPFATYYAFYTLWVQPGSLPGGLAAAWLQNWIWVVSIGLLVVFLPFVFPTGRLLSRRWKPVGWFSACVVALQAFAAAFHPGPLWNDFDPVQVNNPLGIKALGTTIGNFPFGLTIGKLPFGLLLSAVLISATSLLLRWRRASGEERLQIKWFVSIGAILAGLFVVQGLVQYILTISTPAETSIVDFVWDVAFAALPLAIGLAVLKYHLYDIDPIINRTLVYGALTATVIGVYVLVVGSLGLVFQASGNIFASLLATGLVAVLFQPLRDRLQRAVNHLMYGERDDPHAVLVRLGRRLEATLSPDAVLPVIVETVAQALKLPYVAISLKRDEQFVAAVSYGKEPGGGKPRPYISGNVGASLADALIRLPLISQSEHMGELLLAPRGQNAPFTPADRVLLQDLARHIGVALHAVHLTTDLQRLAGELQHSRTQLVTTREEERRRLRRDLHDGLGSALTSVTFQLDAACNLLDRDPAAVKTLLKDLKAQTQASIADIRRLVYNLRPPILDEWGLVAALREQVAQYQLNQVQVAVDAPGSLPALPAAVEVAAYRIALEALANVIRHAQATRCTICLAVCDDALTLEVQDNGKGLPSDYHAGVGISAMRERAAELGGSCVIEDVAAGGTRVYARLPLLKE